MGQQRDCIPEHPSARPALQSHASPRRPPPVPRLPPAPQRIPQTRLRPQQRLPAVPRGRPGCDTDPRRHRLLSPVPAVLPLPAPPAQRLRAPRLPRGPRPRRPLLLHRLRPAAVPLWGQRGHRLQPALPAPRARLPRPGQSGGRWMSPVRVLRPRGDGGARRDLRAPRRPGVPVPGPGRGHGVCAA